jgi:hypothetical protein
MLFRIGLTKKANCVQVKIRKETKNKMSKIKGQTRVRRREDNFFFWGGTEEEVIHMSGREQREGVKVKNIEDLGKERESEGERERCERV